MARLLFECEDSEGNRVYFETTEKEAEELAKSYVSSRQWLLDHGFTPVKAPSAKPREREAVRFDGAHCPRCHGAVWDNRAQKQNDPARSKTPDFACKDKANCKWAVWPGQYEMVPSTV
jgi:hypothetical protein